MTLLQVRDMPEELYEHLANMARRDNRSIAQETIVLLRHALKSHGDRVTRRQQVLADISSMTLGDTASGPDPAALLREDRDR
jgi:plasmid stability protein